MEELKRAYSILALVAIGVATAVAGEAAGTSLGWFAAASAMLVAAAVIALNDSVAASWARFVERITSRAKKEGRGGGFRFAFVRWWSAVVLGAVGVGWMIFAFQSAAR